ncbi:hypothetical protein L9F63_010964, partial [Diploptera punctata]
LSVCGLFFVVCAYVSTRLSFGWVSSLFFFFCCWIDIHLWCVFVLSSLQLGFLACRLGVLVSNSPPSDPLCLGRHFWFVVGILCYLSIHEVLSSLTCILSLERVSTISDYINRSREIWTRGQHSTQWNLPHAKCLYPSPGK